MKQGYTPEEREILRLRDRVGDLETALREIVEWHTEVPESRARIIARRALAGGSAPLPLLISDEDECPCCLTHSCVPFRRYAERTLGRALAPTPFATDMAELLREREKAAQELERLRYELAEAREDAQRAKDEALVYRHKLCHLGKEAALALRLVMPGRLPQEGEE